MREYARRWAFKHPTPADFFRTIENVSGSDLSWFWNAFFYGTSVLDIAIDGVTMRQSGDQRVAEISLRRVTSVPFPVTMRLKLNDGTTQDVRLPVEIWARSDRYTATVSVSHPVVGARLWPDPHVPDWNRVNDTWGEAPPLDRGTASTSGGIVPPIPPSPTMP
jgi:aminopeptidase N